MEYDVTVTNGGSIFLVTPQNENVRDWFKEHVPDAQMLGSSIAVEPRFLHGLLEGLEDHGFSVSEIGV